MTEQDPNFRRPELLAMSDADFVALPTHKAMELCAPVATDGSVCPDEGGLYQLRYMNELRHRLLRRCEYHSMTLFDWFAGQALVGVLASRQGFLVDFGTCVAPGWAYDVAEGMVAEKRRRESAGGAGGEA